MGPSMNENFSSLSSFRWRYFSTIPCWSHQLSVARSSAGKSGLAGSSLKVGILRSTPLVQRKSNASEKQKARPLNEDGRPVVPPRLAQCAHLLECARTGLPSVRRIHFRGIGRNRLRLLSDAIAVRATAREGSLVGRERSGSQHPGIAGRRLARALFPSTPPGRVPRCGVPVNIARLPVRGGADPVRDRDDW